MATLRPASRAEPRKHAGQDPPSEPFRFTLAAPASRRNRTPHATGEAAEVGGDILAGKEIGT